VSDPILHVSISQSPVFLLNSRYPLFCATPSAGPYGIPLLGAPFLPKLQGHFAEFLQGGSLKRLSLLDSSTCVGLGYGLRGLSFFLRELKSLMDQTRASLSDKPFQE